MFLKCSGKYSQILNICDDNYIKQWHEFKALFAHLINEQKLSLKSSKKLYS